MDKTTGQVKIGCIIRSVGERTEKLCVDSVNKYIDEVHIIKNVNPFYKAVENMFEIASKKDWDWFIGLDADIILVPNWYNTLVGYLKQLKHECFRVEFQIKDRFVKPLIWGVHVYNNKFSSKSIDILSKTKHESKPEAAIITQMKTYAQMGYAKNICLGYHGYHQYKEDIFNRFALRVGRNPEWISRYNLFQDGTEESKIGKEGWNYGVKNKNKDFTNYKNKKSYDGEYPELELTLEQFYKEVISD